MRSARSLYGQVVIGPLDGLDDVELGRAQLGEGDLHVLLGGQPAQRQGAEPGELLGDQQVPGQEAGRPSGGRCCRWDRYVLETTGSSSAVTCGTRYFSASDVVAGRLDDPVLGQGLADVGIDRMGPGKARRRRLRSDRGGHRGGMPAGPPPPAL